MTEEYDLEDPDEHEVLGRSSRPRPLEHPIADPVGPGRKRIVITGAGGQLGSALAEAFPEADARDRASFDIEDPPELGYRPDVILHGCVDQRRRRRVPPAEAVRANVRGTLTSSHSACRSSTTRLTTSSTAGRSALRGVGRAEPALRVRPTKLEARGARRLGRSLTVVVRGDRRTSLTMLASGRRQARCRSSTTSVGRRLSSGISPRRRRRCSIFRTARITSPRTGRQPGPSSPRRSSTRRASSAVRRITTAEFPRDAERPAFPSCAASGGAVPTRRPPRLARL